MSAPLTTGLDIRRASLTAAALMAGVFLIAHLPYLPSSLEDLDSINFALGIRSFDVAKHQPHPPGYPLFIAAGKAARALVRSEARALSLLSALAGALGVLAALAVFRGLDGEWTRDLRAIAATVVTITSPLYWFTAVRPLSDMTGLAAALGVQAMTLGARSVAALCGASFLAALATGLRSQVAWLTFPLLALTVIRRPAAERWGTGLRALAAGAAGMLVWLAPLVVLSGGPVAYWRAMFSQGAEDLTGVRMLWTTPTPRAFVAALYSAMVAPWAVWWVAAIVLAAAALGAVRVFRERRAVLVTLAAAFVPYLAFDLLFQETITIRYALPLVVPIAYLAARGASAPVGKPGIAVLVCLAAFDAHIGGTSIAAYARQQAPAFRMLGDMQAVGHIAPSLQPVLAMHRREELDLRRPIVWLGDEMPTLSALLPAPPKHEWLELVKYWNGGGGNLVWFVADPRRSDLALVDHQRRPTGSYEWPLRYPILLGGVRPDAMDWYAIQQPGWYLGEGWALTPETAGVAQEDGRGPGRAPIEAWIRRRREAMRILIGGRNLSIQGPAAQIRVAIDGRLVDEWSASPGFFLRWLRLDDGALEGRGGHAMLTVSADRDHVAIEQFDAQSDGRVVFGYGEGWHEHEYQPETGLTWRWTSERAVLRVHATGAPLVLRLRGEAPEVYFPRPSHLVIRAGGQVIAQEVLSSRFAVDARVPSELLRGEETTIAIETDQVFLPADRSRRTQDRRHLGLRVFECDLSPAS